MAENLFSNKHFGTQESNVIIAQRSLDFPEQYTFFGNLRQIDFNFNSIWVEVQSYPNELQLDVDNLIKVDFIGHPGVQSCNRINNLHIVSYKNPYNIIYNPNAIMDCTNLSAEKVQIGFAVKFQQEGRGTITTLDFVLEIALTKAVPKVGASFKFTSGRPVIKFENKFCCLGVLSITNDSCCKYAETLSIENTIKFDKVFENDIVVWGNEQELHESDPYFDVDEGIRTPDQKIESCLRKVITESKITLRNIVAKNVVSIPVYIDLLRIGNPNENSLECSFTIDSINLGNGKETTTKIPFSVKRDNQCTQMVVKLNGQQIEDGQTNNIGKIKWVKYSAGQTHRWNGITRLMSLQIVNIAENKSAVENAAVVVKNINVIFETDATDVKNAISSNNDNLSEIIELFNSPNSYYTIEYRLKHKEINEIPNDSAKVRAYIDFDYLVDKDGLRDESTEYNHFSSTACFDVETDPGNEWLCIDFGTSATVAAFGDGSEASNLLNLDSQAESITSGLPERLRSPRFEEGTPFLSSNAKFRQGGNFDEKASYNDSFVWLSPTEPQFYNDSYILPYIKSLVGYNNLPDTLDYKGLRYKRGGKNEEFTAAPLTVDEVFTSIYKSLFRDFILPSITNSSKLVNKLILSVPNTYTPRHLDYLHNLVTNNIPQIRKNYIWFISESDAIASYYVTNWYDLNYCRDSKLINQLSSAGSIEHVLAFDMGAGTLDLTYFSIVNNEDDTRDVKILAKIGLNKAGNYLDYLIAEAIIDTHSDLLPESWLNPDGDPTLLLMAGKLKHFIKQSVKPQLFTKAKLTFSELNGEEVRINGKKVVLNDVEINLLAIRDHSAIRNFIKECTVDLIENLFIINGYEKRQTPIDTIIFTGRSVQFGEGQDKGIRNSLMSSIKEWNIKEECQQINISGNDLKTIVCDGALHFATTYSSEASAMRILNRNIYASYGLLYKDIRGNYQYMELLSPSTKPIREPNLETNSTNGVYIYEYDTDRYNAQGNSRGAFVDLRNSPKAFFVQSYSQDTARDWKNNQRELISVMWDFVSQSAVSSVKDLTKVPVRIEVNGENEMIFTAGALTNEPSAPMVININESDSFKKSMWPYM